MRKGCIYNSPIGEILILEDESGITDINFKERLNIEEFEVSKSDNIVLALKQLEEYFLGKRKEFNLKLSIKGTDYQKKIYEILRKIPYGETRFYQEIAILSGNEKASRAIGNANNKNRHLIVIPCHRVIGKNGKLIGYAAGLDKKESLINLEKDKNCF